MSGGVTAAVLASESVSTLSWDNLILPLAILGIGILTLYSKRIFTWLDDKSPELKKKDKKKNNK
ncbi:hypothetical protein [Photobacterium lutimaris]|uniref:Uncharacterized protein n=1 Tax=Photobacterium lutimaris TaxID=388278 RepID=A0A2T3J183_9GAMM|nr:hypothetical protein [Photobacterium lutimaris]PSU34854.1 hypothetical protein C9I99_07135 [Photobacterium lutimaris]TDR77194.1 hypothetical protein DFP78_102202 [Photobacterium lutimaris]